MSRYANLIKIIQYVQSNDSVTLQDIANHVGLSVSGTRKHIQNLQGKNVIKQDFKGAKTTYYTEFKSPDNNIINIGGLL